MPRTTIVTVRDARLASLCATERRGARTAKREQVAALRFELRRARNCAATCTKLARRALTAEHATGLHASATLYTAEADALQAALNTLQGR